MANGSTYAVDADPSPMSGNQQPMPAPRGPVVMPPVSSAPPTVTQPDSSGPSYQQDPAMRAQPPAPVFQQTDASPDYNAPAQMPSSLTSSFVPEALYGTEARSEFAPQISEDLEMNRAMAQSGYRNANLALRDQRLQDAESRQAATAQRDQAIQAQKEKNAQMEQDFQSKGIQYKKLDDGTVHAITDDQGNPIYKPINEKDAIKNGVQYDDDKGSATGTPGRSYVVTRDASGNAAALDPDRNVAAEPWTDDNGSPWLVKKNQYNPWEYIDPTKALASGDPKLQQPAAKALWSDSLAKAETARDATKDAVDQSKDSLDPDKLGVDEKVLAMPPEKQLPVLKATLSGLQQTANTPPPDRGAAWFGLGADRGPDPDAVQAQNEAKQNAAILGQHIQNLENYVNLKQQAAQLKAGGPSAYLQSYLQKKNDVATDLTGSTPAQTTAQTQPNSINAAGASGLANSPSITSGVVQGQPTGTSDTQAAAPTLSGAPEKPDTATGSLVSTPAAQPASPPPVTGGAPASSPQHPLSAFQDFVNNFDQKFSKSNSAGINFAVQAANAYSHSPVAPEHWIAKAISAIGGPDIEGMKNKEAAQIDSAMQRASKGAERAWPTDQTRDKSWERWASDQAENILPMLAGGPRSLPQKLNQFYVSLTGAGQGAEDIKQRGGSENASLLGGGAIGAIYQKAQEFLGPYTSKFLKMVPGASPTVAKAALNYVIGTGASAGRQALELGGINAATAAVTDAALKASGVTDSKQYVNPLQSGLDGAASGALMGGLLHTLEFAQNQVNNSRVGDAIKKEGAFSAFALNTAQQFRAVDEAVAQGKMTPQAAQEAKTGLLHFLTPENRALVQAHVDNLNQYHAEGAPVLADAAQKVLALGKPDPRVSGLSDAELQGELDGTNPTSSHPDDPNKKFGRAPVDVVQAEINRRQQVQAIQADANSKLSDMAKELAQKTTKIQKAAQSPNGLALIDGLNRHNASQTAGTPKADLDTAQLASDISPKTEPNANVQPHTLGYLPVAHDVEKISDPHDRAFAESALKVLNGRQIDPTATKNLVGSEGSGKTPSELPKHIGASGMPLARKDEEGNIILTDEGLNKLRQLVPSAQSILQRDGMPVTSQHLAESKGKADEKSQPKPNKKLVGKNEPTDVPANRVPHLAGLDDKLLNTRLQNLQKGRERLSAAQEIAEKSGISAPLAHHALIAAHDKAIAEHAQEIEARRAQRQAPKNAQESPTGRYWTATGDRGTEVQVPAESYATREEAAKALRQQLPRGELLHDQDVYEPEPNEQKQTSADYTSSTVSEVQPPETKAVEPRVPAEQGAVQQGEATAPETGEPKIAGISDEEMKAHPEAASLVNKALGKSSDILKKLGLAIKSVSLSHKTFGFGFNPNQPDHIGIDLGRVQANIDYLRNHGVSDEGIEMRVQAVVSEEVKHAIDDRAAESIAQDAHTVEGWNALTINEKREAKDRIFRHIHSSLNEEQRSALERLYPGLSDHDPSYAGREYMRMLGQLAQEGRVSEVAHLLTPPAKTFLQRVLDFLVGKRDTVDPRLKAQDVVKSSYEPGKNQLIDGLIARTKAILEAKESPETAKQPQLEAEGQPVGELMGQGKRGQPSLFEQKPLAKPDIAGDTEEDERGTRPDSSGHGTPNATGVPEETGSSASPSNGSQRPLNVEQVRTGGEGSGQTPGGAEVSTESRSTEGTGSGTGSERTGERAGTSIGQKRSGTGPRTLPKIDAESPVNREAASHALDQIKEENRIRKDGALFVGKDGNYAVIRETEGGKYRVSYHDAGNSQPWKVTNPHASLESAVKAVTGRGFYYHGKEEYDLINKLSDMTPEEVAKYVNDPNNHVLESQMHVAAAALPDLGHPKSADVLHREIMDREGARQEDKDRQDALEQAHDDLGASLAEKVDILEGLPLPGSALAGDGLGKSGEYKRLYDAWKFLKNDPNKNWYQQRIVGSRLFSKNAIHTSGEILDKHLPAEGYPGAHDAIQALIDEIESGKPHYAEGVHATAADEYGVLPRTDEQIKKGEFPHKEIVKSPGFEAARRYLLAQDRETRLQSRLNGLAKWLDATLFSNKPLTPPDSRDKALAHIVDSVVGKMMEGGRENRANFSQGIKNIVAWGKSKPGFDSKDALRFTDDLLNHHPVIYPKKGLAKVVDGKITREIPNPEKERQKALIERAQKIGQRRFTFLNHFGDEAQIYTGKDGSAMIRQPMTENARIGIDGKFDNLDAALEHLQNHHYEIMAHSIEKKLQTNASAEAAKQARVAAIKRMGAIIRHGMGLGQTRFMFAHEDGSSANLIIRKDGKISVSGISTTRKFDNLSDAIAHLHDNDFGLMSSKLERDMTAKGVHPDRDTGPRKYTPGEVQTINRYRRARGESELPNKGIVGASAAGPELHSDDDIRNRILMEGSTPEQLKAAYKYTQDRVKDKVRRGVMDSYMAGKESKGNGMRFAALMRQATGNLTHKEQAAKDAYEASNYQGKPVSFEGREATVVGQSFGRVKIKLSDGTTKTVNPDQIGHESEAVHAAPASEEPEQFYSHLNNIIDAKMPGKAKAEQIRAMLKEEGVGNNEMKWTGLENYLKENTEVTKPAIKQFLKENNLSDIGELQRKFEQAEKRNQENPSLATQTALKEADKKLSNAEALFSGSKTVGAAPANEEDDYQSILSDLQKGMPSQDEIDKLRDKALAETPGQQTIGQPRKANYAHDREGRRAIDAIQHAREDALKEEKQSHDQWNREAHAKIEKDPEGTKKDLLKKVLNPEKYGNLTAVDVKAAQILTPQLMSEAYRTGDATKKREAATLAWGYDVGGSEQARAFAARHDPFKTPAQRHLEFLTKVMTTPGKAERKYISEGATQAERNNRLEAAQNERLQKIEKSLSEMGITPEQIFAGETRVVLRTAKFVQDAIGKFEDRAVRTAARMFMDGTPLKEVVKQTGLSKDRVVQARKEFDANLEAKLGEYVRRGFTAADLEKMDMKDILGTIGAAGSEGNLSPEEYKKRLQAMLQKIRPDYADADAGKLVKRRKPINFLPEYQPSKNPIPAYEAMRQEQFAYEKSNKVEWTKFDPANKEQVVRAARLMQAADGNAFEMVHEYWQNSILSGPQTHVAISLGQGLNAMHEFVFKRPIEAALNALIGDKTGVQFGELKHLYSGIAPGLARGWAKAIQTFRTENDLFASDTLDAQMDFKPGAFQGGGHLGVIRGLKGRIIRVPCRVIMALDSFNKNLAGMMDVGAQAYRLGKAQGLDGDDLSTFIDNEIKTPGSPSWFKAYNTASNEVGLHGEVPQVIKSVMDARNLREGTTLVDKMGRFALSMLFPFVKVPYNLTRIGLRKSPLGIFNAIGHVGNGLYAYKSGKFFTEGYSKAQMVSDMAEQFLAWGAAGLLLSSVEGDKDDDKKQLLITAPRYYGVNKSGEIDALDRKFGGPSMIRIGGRDGFYLNYGKYEPLATVLGTIATGVRAFKDKPGNALPDIMSGLVGQLKGNSFIQGMSTILDTLDAASKGDTEGLGAKWVQQVAQGFVPNIFRQPIRNWDDAVRDSKFAGPDYLMTQNPAFAQQMHNLYGQPETKTSEPPLRVLFPAGTKPTPEMERGDEFLTNYNRNAEKPYWPDRPSKAAYSLLDRTGKKVEMTDLQASAFDKIAGQLFKQKLNGWLTPAVAQNPTEQFKKRFTEDLEDARHEAREKIQHAYNSVAH